MRKFIYLANLFMVSFTFAQFNFEIQTPKSPDVYSFEKYGNTSINTYTGRQGFSINLYNIEYGDIEIPLNLSYNSNGIRVDEEASECGLGWFLSINDCIITQQVNGKNDLLPGVFVERPDYFTGNLGYVIDPVYGTILKTASTPSNDLNTYSVTKLRSKGLTDPGNCFLAMSFDGGLYYLKNNQTKEYYNRLDYESQYEDFEMDYFTASFFGHSITFCINPRQSVNSPYYFTVLNNDKYKIQLQNGEWIITTPSGEEYFFSKKLKQNNIPSQGSNFSILDSNNINENITQYSVESSSTNSIAYYNSFTWKLTKIKDTRNREMNFVYEDLNAFGTTKLNSIKLNISNIATSLIQYSYHTSFNLKPFLGPAVSYMSDFINNSGLKTYIKKSISFSAYENCILKEINYSDNKINFNYSDRLDLPNSKKIDSINISYKNILRKTFHLEYDYFNSTSSESIQKRLKLESLSLGNDNPYLFEYNTTPLPSKNSNSYDYWGYYNGFQNSSPYNNPFRLFEDSTQIPSWSKPLMSLFEGKCNKSAHPEFCQAGILKKVTYPTAGYTEFEYELNEFDNIFFPDYNNKISLDGLNNYINNYTQETSKGFGLRVKRISDFDGIKEYIKKYSYFGGKHIPFYKGYTVKNLSMVNPSPIYNINDQTYSPWSIQGQTISTSNALLFQNSFLGNGNFVGYDSVSVENKTETNDTNGKQVFSFTNYPDVSPKSVYDNGYASSIGFDSDYFDLLGTSIRSSNIDNGLLIQEDVSDKNNSLIKKVEYSRGSMSFSPLKYNVKLINYETRFNTSEISCVINPGYGDWEIKTFYYKEYLMFYFPLKKADNRLFSEKTTEYFPSGSKRIQTIYSYNINKIPNGKSIKDQFGNEFYSEGSTMNNSPDFLNKNILTFPKTKGIAENGTTKKYYNFEYQNINDIILPSKVEELPEGNPDSSKIINLFYDQYDDKNNLIQYHKEHGIYTSIIWGYDKTLPIAKIENAQYSEIQPSLIQTIQNSSDNETEQQLISNLNILRSSLPNAMITTFTHKPLIGVSSITDPKGNIVTYHYNLTTNRLEVVKNQDGNILNEYEYHFKPQN